MIKITTHENHLIIESWFPPQQIIKIRWIRVQDNVVDTKKYVHLTLWMLDLEKSILINSGRGNSSGSGAFPGVRGVWVHAIMNLTVL